MLDINISSYDKDSDFEPNEKSKSFTNRAICTGGTRNAVLLPNGDLTICEELYDHPQFILGNIKRNSLNEIWNSDKAKALYNMSDKLNQHSACRNCGDFANCRNNEGVCWKMILMAYGMDNWDYPDPRCPKAPKPFNKFYYE